MAIEQVTGATEPVVEVWEEHRAVFELFAACGTQWRCTVVAGLGGGGVLWQGLDYAGVRQVADAHSIDWTSELLADLQVMESEALTVRNKR